MKDQKKPTIHSHSANLSAKPATESAGIPNQPQSSKAAEEVIRHVQEIMWRDVGIVRSGESLRKAISQLDHLRACLPREHSRRAHEAQNILQTGLLIARSALAREESRGAHYRIDFPSPDDARFKKHSIVQHDNIRFE